LPLDWQHRHRSHRGAQASARMVPHAGPSQLRRMVDLRWPPARSGRGHAETRGPACKRVLGRRLQLQGAVRCAAASGAPRPGRGEGQGCPQRGEAQL